MQVLEAACVFSGDANSAAEFHQLVAQAAQSGQIVVEVEGLGSDDDAGHLRAFEVDVDAALED